MGFGKRLRLKNLPMDNVSWGLTNEITGACSFSWDFVPDREKLCGELNLLLGGKQFTNASKLGTIVFKLDFFLII